MFDLFLSVCKKNNLSLYDDIDDITSTIEQTNTRLNYLYGNNKAFYDKFNQWKQLQLINDFDIDNKISYLENTLKSLELEIYLIQTTAVTCYSSNSSDLNTSRTPNHELLPLTQLYKNSVKNSIKDASRTLSVLLPNHYIYCDPYKSKTDEESHNIRAIQQQIDLLTDKLRNIHLNEKKPSSGQISSLDKSTNIISNSPSSFSTTPEENEDLHIESAKDIFLSFLNNRVENAEQFKTSLINKTNMCNTCFLLVQNKLKSVNIFAATYNLNLIKEIINENILTLLNELIDMFNKCNSNFKKRIRPT